jgi:hypothetical protein
MAESWFQYWDSERERDIYIYNGIKDGAKKPAQLVGKKCRLTRGKKDVCW